MVQSEDIREIVNQTAVYAPRVVMMELRDVEAGPWLTTLVRNMETQWWRNSESILKKPAFNWAAQYRYVELMHFEMEVTNIIKSQSMQTD